MAAVNRDPSQPTGTPAEIKNPAGEAYSPPAVEWEEEFDPVALSDPLQCPNGGHDC